jgi:hypothetical protein
MTRSTTLEVNNICSQRLVSYALAFKSFLAQKFSSLKCKKIAENVINSTFSAIVETVGLEAIGRKGKSFVYGTFPD